MKKQVAILSTAFIATIFVLSSCQNDDNLVLKSKTQLITQGSWKFDKATSGTPATDVSASIAACYKDNVVSFTSSTNGTVSDGVPCATPAPANFTWSFQSGETILSFDAALFPGGGNNFSLVALTENSLVISQDVIVPPSPTPVNVVFYYKH